MSAGDGFTRVLAAMESAGRVAHVRGGRAELHCPGPSHARGDIRPSGWLMPGDTGAVLGCFAGCAPADILAAVGLTWPDAFDDRDDRAESRRRADPPFRRSTPPPAADPPSIARRPSKDSGPRSLVATYVYRDEAGAALFRVLRWAPKSFTQLGPTGGTPPKDVRRVPFRLPELLAGVAAGHDVWIVEGEKDVETLVGLGLVATTTSGGGGNLAQSAAELSVALSGAERVNVVIDDDPTGRVYGRALVALFGAARLTVWLPTRGKDITEHLSSGGTLGDLASADLADEADEWLEPVPVLAPPRLPPPLEVLPGWVAEHIVAVAAAKRVGVDMTAAVALGAVSAAIAGRVRLVVSGSFGMPVLLWLVIGADSGVGKSTLRELSAPLGQLDDVLREEWSRSTATARLAAARAAKQADEAERAYLAGRADAPSVAQVAQLGDDARALAAAVPPCPRLVVDDVTPQMLVPLLVEHGGHLAVVADEAGFLRAAAGIGAAKGYAAALDATLLAFDGGRLIVDRKGATRADRESLVVPAAHLSVCVAAQTSVVFSLLGDRELGDRGWSARAMVVLADDPAGSRDYLVELPDSSHTDRWVELLTGLARDLIAAGGLTMTLTAEARHRFLGWEQAIEAELGLGGALSSASLRPWGEKWRLSVARLAALLHLLHGHPASEPVALEMIEGAITWGEHWRSHRVAADAMSGTSARSVAGVILAALERLAARPDGVLRGVSLDDAHTVSLRDMHRLAESSRPDVEVEAVRTAVDLLVERGWLRAVDPTPPDAKKRSGRPPSDRFAVHPLLRRESVASAPAEGAAEPDDDEYRPFVQEIITPSEREIYTESDVGPLGVSDTEREIDRRQTDRRSISDTLDLTATTRPRSITPAVALPDLIAVALDGCGLADPTALAAELPEVIDGRPALDAVRAALVDAGAVRLPRWPERWRLTTCSGVAA